MLFRRPQIWTPFSDRCRTCGRTKRRRGLFDPLKFAAGDIMLDSSGNEILDASGNVLLDDGSGCTSCCGSSGFACTGCATAPSTRTVVFDGVAYCCAVGIGKSFQKISGDLNGTWTLTQLIGSACRWQYSGSDITSASYSNVSCSGPSATTSDFFIDLNYLTGGTWSLSAYIVDNVEITYGLFQNLSFSGASNCTSAMSGIANGLTTCGEGSPRRIATGGAASVA